MSNDVRSKKNWTAEEIENLISLITATNVQSLNKPIRPDPSNPDYTELYEFIRDDGPSPQELVELKETHDTLVKYVNKLRPRESAVLKMRFGLEDREPKTLEEVATYYGLSRERVRQIERRGLAKLRWLLITKSKCKNIYDV